MFRHFAASQFHFVEMSFSLNSNSGPFRESVDDRNTYAMKTAGNRIAIAAELTTCMEYGQYHFHSRFTSFMHACWNTTAIIGNGAAAIIIQSDFDMGAIASQCFIDTVIHHFIHQMVQPSGRCRTDVHPWTKTYCF